jgi:hypothetical protein
VASEEARRNNVLLLELAPGLLPTLSRLLLGLLLVLVLLGCPGSSALLHPQAAPLLPAPAGSP